MEENNKSKILELMKIIEKLKKRRENRKSRLSALKDFFMKNKPNTESKNGD